MSPGHVPRSACLSGPLRSGCNVSILPSGAQPAEGALQSTLQPILSILLQQPGTCRRTPHLLSWALGERLWGPGVARRDLRSQKELKGVQEAKVHVQEAQVPVTLASGSSPGQQGRLYTPGQAQVMSTGSQHEPILQNI